MPYNQPVKCRFYLNALEYYATVKGSALDNVHYILPVDPQALETEPLGGDLDWALSYRPSIPRGILKNRDTKDNSGSFIAILGHEMRGKNIRIAGRNPGEAESHFDIWSNVSNIVNTSNDFGHILMDNDGFSIAIFDGKHMGDSLKFSSAYVGLSNIKIGSIAVGVFYTIRPDKSLFTGYRYKERKNIKSYKGSYMSNSYNHKPPLWGEKLAAWELWGPDSPLHFTGLSRSGRRFWRLKYSLIDELDMLGISQKLNVETGVNLENMASAGYSTDELETGGELKEENTLLRHSNWFSTIYSMALGPNLPFIFQPNIDEDVFAICRFKASSLKIRQESLYKYTISVTIEENW